MNTKIKENVHSNTDNSHHQIIHISVDGEKYEAIRKMMTPNEIIREFGQKDSALHYLVQIHGNEKNSYEGSGETQIELHNGMRFQIISMAPCTVSDISRTGIETFIHGLTELEYSPMTLPGKPDHVVIDYVVPCGKFVNKKVRLGFIVPVDFPVTTPSGPHVSPYIHPIMSGGQHPTGGIHVTHSKEFQESTGEDWQYWSRPVPDWASRQKTVISYMSHIWRLWDTQ